MEPISRIFLIDDDKVSNRMHEAIIRRFDKTIIVQPYTDALEALHVLEQLTERDSVKIPDVIFLDINMPVINGWEFLERFRAMSKAVQAKCKIYILTSSMEQEDINRSRSYTVVTSFISKPLMVEHLALVRDVRLEQLSIRQSPPNQ